MIAFKTTEAEQFIMVELRDGLLQRAQAAELDLPAIFGAAITAELARRDRARWDAEIAHACREHEEYLAEYGSLADVLRAEADADE